jgi:hypothetical protein
MAGRHTRLAHHYGFRMRATPLLILLLAAIWAEPTYAGPPYLTDDPEPVDYQHWEVYGFSMGSQVAGGSAGFLPAMEVNYGALPNLQLHTIVPVAYSDPSAGGTRVGLGDIELGTKYRFVEQDKDGWMPSIGAFPLVETPTGNAARGLGAGHTQIYLPIWIQKDFGDWTTYGGGGYWINPGAGRRNFWFAGWLLQYQLTKQLAVGTEIFHTTANSDPGRAATGFNVGFVFDFNDHWHMLGSAGHGLQNPSATNRFSYYFGIQNTF